MCKLELRLKTEVENLSNRIFEERGRATWPGKTRTNGGHSAALAMLEENANTWHRRAFGGRENLVGRVEEIRKPGAKVSRKIPADLAAEAEHDTPESE
jgi:hypothetical protein